MKKGKKITILGAGNVGATIAYTLALDGMASELVLIDINEKKPKEKQWIFCRERRFVPL